jgi:tRNA (cytidine/uridine-2'-O-)-methyltransferase
MLHVVLVEPEVPPNTGSVGRLCLAAGARLHLVRPLGFDIDDRTVRRAGLDYWEHVDLVVHDSMDAWLATVPVRDRMFLLTTKTDRPYDSVGYCDGDWLVFGRETRGLPESLLAAHPGQALTIPTSDAVRSLNLATAVGIVLFEALRQMRAGPTRR